MLRILLMGVSMYVIWVSFLGGNDFLGVATLWNGSIDYSSVMEEIDIVDLNETDKCLRGYIEKQYSPEDAERLCKIRMRNE